MTLLVAKNHLHVRIETKACQSGEATKDAACVSPSTLGLEVPSTNGRITVLAIVARS